ncbi:hypothetical protein AAF712_011710 [Marasmius tenuissimus]|uniref:RNA-dependent RNA polymerase n=1 Tax=Marasmius tenuissimus TaxID=585030 RepID=A0ABR2ZIL2_9AGAR
MILGGPDPSQTNRVIRRYEGYEENFIRVHFREEDELRFRWDREVEEKPFLKERVGGLLKNGFYIGGEKGRHFEFLAYSNSSLREHTVWFMSPFEYPVEDANDTKRYLLINAETIRKTFGHFENIREEDYVGQDAEFGFYKQDLALLRQPSKLAARFALNFTASIASVSIRRDEWEIVPDICCGEKSIHIFTDGIGTISEELGNRIWASLDDGRSNCGDRAVQPSAYKIRFLGFKGMVSVDRELDRAGGKIQMRLRPSMRKFSGKGSGADFIEIAGWRGRPGVSHLNKRDSFLTLTDDAIRATYKVHESLSESSEFMDEHNFGSKYNLSYILKELARLGGRMGNSTDVHPGTPVDNPFLTLMRDIGEKHVLREIMHDARILIPGSHHLVGVADEGPGYRGQAGYENLRCLKPHEIYVCTQKHGKTEPTYLEGRCIISRSPVTHPGDVQHVFAIGKPSADTICLFTHLKNVVVLPCTGSRSLASCLGGGDLDGDEFDIIPNPEGWMYRKVSKAVPEDNDLQRLIDAVNAGSKERPNVRWDPITILIEAKLRSLDIETDSTINGSLQRDYTLSALFRRYRDELGYICAIYPLQNAPSARLLEAEVMGFHVGSVVDGVRKELECAAKDLSEDDMARQNLRNGWKTWKFVAAQALLEDNFGANSLALVVLGFLLKNIEKLETAPKK